MSDWKVLKSKKVHKNNWYNVIQDEVEIKEGKKIFYHYIDKPPGVAVVPVDDDGNIFFVKQYRHPIKIDAIEFVLGTMEKFDVDVLEVAKRELKEETGIESLDCKEIGKFFWMDGLSNQVGHIFLAKKLTIGESHPEETEDITVVKYSLEEVKQMIKDEEIKDAATIAVFYRYLQYLET
jgi:ADP-ribose pyrophosphatase